jgi:hypothetical protein
MKLISELTEEVKYLVEEKTPGKKDYYIEGVYLQGNRQNRNNRVYKADILEKEVKRYTDEYINKNRAFGELGHPQGPTINLERSSHIIKSLVREGDDFIGRAKVLDTPYGQIVKNLINEGAQLGVSSRGMGSLKENKDGIMEVQDDFYLATAADIVADPSAPDAFVRGIMEGVEWVWENGILKQQTIESYKKMIQKAPMKRLDETKVKVFESFFQELSQK